MAKSKVVVISGPMDAKHVGGINVMGGNQPSMLDGYFNKNALQPDELPSHTSIATTKIEVPKRSDTIAGTIRRPSLSIKRSLSKLRRRSTISHASEPHSTSKASAGLGRSDSVDTKRSARTLRVRSSLSHLRQRVGLDRDLSASPPVSQRVAQEPGGAPATIWKLDLPLRLYDSPPPSHRVTLEPKATLAPVRKKDLPLRAYESSAPSHRVTPESKAATAQLRKNDLPLRAYASLSRHASSSSKAPELRKPIASTYIPRNPSLSQRDTSFAERKTSNIARKPSTIQGKSTLPLYRQTITPSSRSSQPPSRPKRADSGTAVAFDKVPAQQRPLPFQEIMAVKIFAERMAMYKRMREYWACAEHGLVEWTGKAAGPKIRA